MKLFFIFLISIYPLYISANTPVPRDLINEIDSRLLYELEVIPVNLTGKVQYIYLLGESHSKGVYDSNLGIELLSYFNFRAVELISKAEEESFEYLRPKKSKRLRSSTIYEAMVDSYFIWSWDYIYEDLKRINLKDMTDDSKSLTFNIEQGEGFLNSLLDCLFCEPIISKRNQKMASNLKKLLLKYPNIDSILVIVGIIHYRGMKKRLQAY